MSHIMPTYFNRSPIAFERGEGAWLWDTEGKQYLDALAGIAVCSLGHAHPAITKTICEQSAKLLHTSNGFTIPNQEKLATKLCQLSGMEQVYFANSGAEANEAAIKLTRMHARKRGINQPTVITMIDSFHGRTFATMCATGTSRIQAGFEPLMPGFVHLALNDIQALKDYIAKDPNVVAIMLEPIQGDGGLHMASQAYLETIRALCDERDMLMIIDEIQTGIGRSGKWFAYQHFNIQPDIVTLAKALANGFPIGACMARGKACNLFGPGKHGCTFGGGPLACAVANTVLEVMEQNHIPEHTAKIGHYFLNKLQTTFASYPEVKGFRGRGLMLGMELDRNAFELLPIALKHGLVSNIVANKVVRFLPPLIITESQADEIVIRLQIALDEFLSLSPKS